MMKRHFVCKFMHVLLIFHDSRWDKKCLDNVPTSISNQSSPPLGQADASDRPGVRYDANAQCQKLTLNGSPSFSGTCVNPNRPLSVSDLGVFLKEERKQCSVSVTFFELNNCINISIKVNKSSLNSLQQQNKVSG